MARLSKRQKALQEKVGGRRDFSPMEALDLIKETANAKFDETIEAAFYLGINPKHADQQVRSTVTLPEGTGQTVRVVAVAKGAAANAAKEAGAIEAGAEEVLEKIQGGWFDFDVLVATADMMPNFPDWVKSLVLRNSCLTLKQVPLLHHLLMRLQKQ